MYAYADDLAIIGKDKEKLEEAITIVQNWTDKNKMKINKKKSAIIFYKTPESPLCGFLISFSELPYFLSQKFDLGLQLIDF